MAKCELVVGRPWNVARKWRNTNSWLQVPWNAARRWRNANSWPQEPWNQEFHVPDTTAAVSWARVPCPTLPETTVRTQFHQIENASHTTNTFLSTNTFLTFLKFLVIPCNPRVLASGPKPCEGNKNISKSSSTSLLLRTASERNWIQVFLSLVKFCSVWEESVIRKCHLAHYSPQKSH